MDLRCKKQISSESFIYIEMKSLFWPCIHLFPYHITQKAISLLYVLGKSCSLTQSCTDCLIVPGTPPTVSVVPPHWGSVTFLVSHQNIKRAQTRKKKVRDFVRVHLTRKPCFFPTLQAQSHSKHHTYLRNRSLLLLDLSTAFDTVTTKSSTPHSLSGILGSALCWFMSDLSLRSFRVSWRGEVSQLHSLLTRVPQGSILRPLLTLTLCADDTQLSYLPEDHTVMAHISSRLTGIPGWMKEYCLQLNHENRAPYHPSQSVYTTTDQHPALINPTQSWHKLGCHDWWPVNL